MIDALHIFAVWLDTPAGGDWFQALLMLGIFLFILFGGARRG